MVKTRHQPANNNGDYEIIFTPNNINAYDYSGIALRRIVKVAVSKASQTIIFPVIAQKQVGDAPFSVNAIVSTGLP